MRTLLLLFGLLLSMTACSNKTPFPMDREWVLDIMNGKKMSGDNAFTLNFDAATNGYSGKACNSYRGTYTLEKSTLTFGPGATTKMMCPNQEVEDEYMTALATIDGFRHTGTNLFLQSGGVDVLMFK